MTKLLTNREMELFRVAMTFAERLDNANPEVGVNFGFKDRFAAQVASLLSFTIDPDDIAEVCEEIRGQ